MKYFKLIFLLVLLIFFYDVYKGNDIFEKLKELEIIDSLISNDFYITFSLLAIVIAIYSTILNYKEDLKKLIDKKEHSLNKINLIYSLLVFVILGFTFVFAQRNLLLDDIRHEQEQKNYIQSLEKRIQSLEYIIKSK